MPRRSTPEAVINEYFEQQPLAKCEVMQNIINSTMKRRKKAEAPQEQKPAKGPSLLEGA